MFDKKENTALFSFPTSSVNLYRLSHQRHCRGAVEQKMSSRLPVSPPTKHVGGGGTRGGSYHLVQLCFVKCLAIYLLASGRADVIWSWMERKDVKGMKPL